MNKQGDLSIATEAIHTQDGSFFAELVKDIQALPRNERQFAKRDVWEALENRLSKTTAKFTGLKIKYTINIRADLGIIVPIFDYQNILYSHILEAAANPDTMLKELRKLGDEIRTEVDLKKSFVSGDLAKSESEMFLNQLAFSGRFRNIEYSDEELASIILHEIGHHFTALEYLDRSVATNQVLAQLQRDLLSNKEPSKRESLIKTSGKELSIDRNTVSELIGKEDKIVTTIFMSQTLKQLRTQSGHSFYDMNTWEMLSDQFATRHGAGAHLANALAKMDRQNPDLTSLSSFGSIARQASYAVAGLFLLVAGVYGITLGTALATFMGVIGVFLGYATFTYDHSFSEPTYDNAVSRLKRIRNVMVQQAKSFLSQPKSKFNTFAAEKLEDDIELLDKLMVGMEDRTSFVLKVYAFFNASEANRQANVVFQKELETLANNDLYVKALALKAA